MDLLAEASIFAKQQFHAHSQGGHCPLFCFAVVGKTPTVFWAFCPWLLHLITFPFVQFTSVAKKSAGGQPRHVAYTKITHHRARLSLHRDIRQVCPCFTTYHLVSLAFTFLGATQGYRQSAAPALDYVVELLRRRAPLPVTNIRLPRIAAGFGGVRFQSPSLTSPALHRALTSRLRRPAAQGTYVAASS